VPLRVRGVTVSVKQPTKVVFAEYAGRHVDDATVAAWIWPADKRRKAIVIGECILK
jgi:hypothetical protein